MCTFYVHLFSGAICDTSLTLYLHCTVSLAAYAEVSSVVTCLCCSTAASGHAPTYLLAFPVYLLIHFLALRSSEVRLHIENRLGT